MWMASIFELATLPLHITSKSLATLRKVGRVNVSDRHCGHVQCTVALWECGQEFSALYKNRWGGPVFTWMLVSAETVTEQDRMSNYCGKRVPVIMVGHCLALVSEKTTTQRRFRQGDFSLVIWSQVSLQWVCFHLVSTWTFFPKKTVFH